MQKITDRISDFKLGPDRLQTEKDLKSDQGLQISAEQKFSFDQFFSDFLLIAARNVLT